MALRITNSIMINNYVRNLQTNQQRMDKLQNQIETTRKIVRLSDDPVGVVKLLKISSKMADIETYKSNIADAKAWMTQTETTVDQMNTYVQRLYELSVRLSNETIEPEDRMAAASEIAQLRDQIVTVGNTTLADKYMFGSFNVAKAPFVAEPSDPSDPSTMRLLYNGCDMTDMLTAANVSELNRHAADKIKVKVGFGVDMDISMNGVELMGIGDDNIYKIVNDFLSACNKSQMVDRLDENGDPVIDPLTSLPVQDKIGTSTWEDISPFITKLQGVQQRLVSMMTELGGRQERLDVMESGYTLDTINYTEMRGKIEEIDMAETITYFSMAEAVYRAALGIGSRVIQPTLMDFLR